MTQLLSEVPYGAFLAYSPHGPANEPLHGTSQRFVRALKEDGQFRGESAIDLAVRRLAEVRPEELENWVGADVLAVPAPRSSPFPPRGLEVPLRGTDRDFLWVPRRICEELVRTGLVADTQALLVRERRVARAATAGPGARPLPQQHLDSLSCLPLLHVKPKILVVDDVVTRGATLLACASLLAERFPEAEVATFALVRAISTPQEFLGMMAPVEGTVTLRLQGDTLRRP